MMELYRLLGEMNSDQNNMVLTLLEEGSRAEKALISGGKMVWCSVQDGFLSKHAAQFLTISKNGTVEFEGKKIYCETVGREKSLVVCGGGHVSIPVIQIGKMLGFWTVVLEDRPKFADNARRAGADEVYCEAFEDGLSRIDGNPDTFFVIVTRGHRHDQVCLEKIAAKEHAYIGMIGSRGRTAMVKKHLADIGVDRTVLDQVYTPIGLDIAAKTPAEIAVAIMAEIIEVKNRRTTAGGYPKDVLRAILDEQTDHGGKVLVTIVERHGSAPREVGAKMLVMQDGTTVGSVGGGCVEADVFAQARRMLTVPSDIKVRLCHVDMTADEAAEEGMVCGGNIDVLMEMMQV